MCYSLPSLFCAGEDFEAHNYIQAKIIHINEVEVEIEPVMINDDDFPEGNEAFFLSLNKGEGTDTLNIFPSTSSAEVVIQDNDGKRITTKTICERCFIYIIFFFIELRIGFEWAMYSVVEGEVQFVEVCITVAEGQSLNHGHSSAVINISTSTGTATSKGKMFATGLYTWGLLKQLPCYVAMNHA